MSLDLVLPERKTILYPKAYEVKYSAFEVGYHGDYAGIKFEFCKAVFGRSSQHLKYKEISFEVVTPSEIFCLASLENKISNLNRASLENGDAEVLKDGLKVLKAFIGRNGITNPQSSCDWEVPLQNFG